MSIAAWNVWRKVLPHFAWTCFENLEAVSKLECHVFSSSSNALASFRSSVSKPSVNQP